jgi:hypothetical protein
MRIVNFASPSVQGVLGALGGCTQSSTPLSGLARLGLLLNFIWFPVVASPVSSTGLSTILSGINCEKCSR